MYTSGPVVTSSDNDFLQSPTFRALTNALDVSSSGHSSPALSELNTTCVPDYQAENYSVYQGAPGVIFSANEMPISQSQNATLISNPWHRTTEANVPNYQPNGHLVVKRSNPYPPPAHTGPVQLHDSQTVANLHPYNATMPAAHYSTRYQYRSSSAPRTNSTKRLDDNGLTGDDLRRRHLRRQRNKEAAARCRQRRVDLTGRLEKETEELEDQKHKLENEYQRLQSKSLELHAVLDSHVPICDKPILNIKEEPYEPMDIDSSSLSIAVDQDGEDSDNEQISPQSSNSKRPGSLSMKRKSSNAMKLTLDTNFDFCTKKLDEIETPSNILLNTPTSEFLITPSSSIMCMLSEGMFSSLNSTSFSYATNTVKSGLISPLPCSIEAQRSSSGSDTPSTPKEMTAL